MEGQQQQCQSCSWAGCQAVGCTQGLMAADLPAGAAMDAKLGSSVCPGSLSVEGMGMVAPSHPSKEFKCIDAANKSKAGGRPGCSHRCCSPRLKHECCIFPVLMTVTCQSQCCCQSSQPNACDSSGARMCQRLGKDI